MTVPLPAAATSPAQHCDDRAALQQVSVVVPARDAASTLANQLEALASQTCPMNWEVVVVVDRCRDRTGAIARSWAPQFPRLRIVPVSRPGTSAARNAGCRAAFGDGLLFCDADDVVAPGWLPALVEGLHRFDAMGGPADRTTLNSRQALAARPASSSRGLPSSFGFLPYAIGANCAVRRDIWERVGGFDESLHYGGDDIDFFWRVQLAGGTLGYAPAAVVHYRLRHSLLATMRQLFRYGLSHPGLYRRYATLSMPASRASGYGHPEVAWRRIATGVPRALGCREEAWRVLADASFRCGRLVGSVRHRVLYL